MKPPRFTMRRLMALVAVAGLLLGTWIGLERRRERFEHLFGFHNSRTGPASFDSFDGSSFIYTTEKGRCHHEMAEKYAEAARRPWMPIAPDPPEPR